MTPQHLSPLAEHFSFIKDRELTAPSGFPTLLYASFVLSTVVHLLAADGCV